jgi:gluconolactonase
VMWFDQPPRVIETRLFSAMPERLRRNAPSAWANANKAGAALPGFIEGPCFDRAGNLYVTDIPFGRIFRIDAGGAWHLVIEYDGQPNGLKLHPDGRFLLADYRNGLMQLDPAAGTIKPVLTGRNSEAFKGINDLAIARNGDIYFTDQGQTGLHDPSGRVYRLAVSGRLDCLLDNGPSPNGLVLDASEKVLFVAMTRDNAVWRLPLTEDGATAKVGRFCSLFGVSGPDGLAMDEAGHLLVAHASLGHVFMFAPTGELVARIRSCAGQTCTNVAFGGPDRRSLYITESATCSVLLADLPHAGA